MLLVKNKSGKEDTQLTPETVGLLSKSLIQNSRGEESSRINNRASQEPLEGTLHGLT